MVVLFSTLWQADDETSPENDEDVAAIMSIFGWLERHASSRVAEVRLVAASSLKAFRMLMNAYEDRKARRAAVRSSGWPAVDEDESFGDALRRISTMVAVPDILAAGAADEAMYVTPAAITGHGTGMSLDSLLAPGALQQQHHQLPTDQALSSSSASSLQVSPFGSTPPLGMYAHNPSPLSKEI